MTAPKDPDAPKTLPEPLSPHRIQHILKAALAKKNKDAIVRVWHRGNELWAADPFVACPAERFAPLFEKHEVPMAPGCYIVHARTIEPTEPITDPSKANGEIDAVLAAPPISLARPVAMPYFPIFLHRVLLDGVRHALLLFDGRSLGLPDAKSWGLRDDHLELALGSGWEDLLHGGDLVFTGSPARAAVGITSPLGAAVVAPILL